MLAIHTNIPGDFAAFSHKTWLRSFLIFLSVDRSGKDHEAPAPQGLYDLYLPPPLGILPLTRAGKN